MAFHQRRDVTVFCDANEIALPMTGNSAVLDFSGPFPDGDGIYDLTARVNRYQFGTRVRYARASEISRLVICFYQNETHSISKNWTGVIVVRIGSVFGRCYMAKVHSHDSGRHPHANAGWGGHTLAPSCPRSNTIQPLPQKHPQAP